MPHPSTVHTFQGTWGTSAHIYHVLSLVPPSARTACTVLQLQEQLTDAGLFTSVQLQQHWIHYHGRAPTAHPVPALPQEMEHSRQITGSLYAIDAVSTTSFECYLASKLKVPTATSDQIVVCGGNISNNWQ